MTDRFMASAMSLVRIAPDAPTSAPAMIRTGLSMTKPAIATAVPVNEFSRLMTTGMSAPPIGSVIVTPKISAAARIRRISARFGVPVANRTAAATTVDCGERQRHEAAARDQDRLARDEALELAGRDQRPGEGDRADDDVEDDEDVLVEADVAADTGEAQVVVDRDERRRAAADRVEQRHQLRHRGHLHDAGGVQAQPAADDDPADDDRPARGADAEALGREQLAGEDQDRGRDDGQDHAAGRHEVAVAGRGRRVHPGQADDERHGARQPGDPDEDLDDARAWSPARPPPRRRPAWERRASS